MKNRQSTKKTVSRLQSAVTKRSSATSQTKFDPKQVEGMVVESVKSFERGATTFDVILGIHRNEYDVHGTTPTKGQVQGALRRLEKRGILENISWKENRKCYVYVSKEEAAKRVEAKRQRDMETAYTKDLVGVINRIADIEADHHFTSHNDETGMEDGQIVISRRHLIQLLDVVAKDSELWTN